MSFKTVKIIKIKLINTWQRHSEELFHAENTLNDLELLNKLRARENFLNCDVSDAQLCMTFK